MNREEFLDIANAIRAYYPKEKVLNSPETARLWFEALKDLDYSATVIAIHNWAAREKWSPSISEIRASVAEIILGPVPDWSEAWENLRAQIRRLGYYRQPEIIEALDPLTRKVAQRLGLTQIITATDGEYEVNRANFRQIYQAEAQRERRNALLPQNIRDGIEQLQRRAIDDGQGNQESD